MVTRIAARFVADRRLVDLDAELPDPWAALAAYSKRIEDARAATARAELGRLADRRVFQQGREAHDLRPLPLRAWKYGIGAGNYSGPVALRCDVIA